MSYYPSGSQGGGKRILAVVALVLVTVVLGAVLWSGAVGRRSQPVGELRVPSNSAPTAMDDADLDNATKATPPAFLNDNKGVTTHDVFGSAKDIIKSAKHAVVNVLNYQGSAVLGGGFVPEGEEKPQKTDDLVGFGSGVIISEDGYIITNHHVINQASTLKVTLYDGTEYEAKVIGSDAKVDLALLKVDASGLTALRLGDSTQMEMGDLAITIGYLELGIPSATAGIISCPSQQVVMNNWPTNMLQIDAAINPGNSGGALLNGKGELIGINTLKKNYVGFNDYGMLINADGIGFAIPSSEVKSVITDLMEYGYVRRPTIGISSSIISEEMAQISGVPAGVKIEQVSEGSAAEKAGLRVGDLVIAADGNKVSTVVDINKVLHERKIGDTLVLTIQRGDETLDVSVVLGEPIHP